MKGPFLPLYGSGAIMMLLVSSPFQEHIWMVYIAGCLGATVLEYVTGTVMEALFKVRYWDYSKQPFNFQGHVCLGTSLSWGFLTILMTEIVHKPVEKLVLAIPHTILLVVTIVLTIAIVSDFTLAFKAALDLRDVLMKMDKVKAELVHVQKRLDVILAVADEGITKTIGLAKEDLVEKLHIEELKDGIEEKLSALKNHIASDYLDGVKEEIQELRIKYRLYLDRGERLFHFKDFYRKNIFKNNPSISSVRFKESLEELRESLEKRKQNKDEEKKDE